VPGRVSVPAILVLVLVMTAAGIIGGVVYFTGLSQHSVHVSMKVQPPALLHCSSKQLSATQLLLDRTAQHVSVLLSDGLTAACAVAHHTRAW